MKRNYLILIPIIILMFISIIYLPNSFKFKQIIWCFLGVILSIFISRIRFKFILKYSLFYYVIGIILLCLVLVLNKFTNGSRGWISFGGFSFQPSEIMKVCLILFSVKYYKRLNIWLFFLSYLVPMVLIFLEPDTGAVLIEGIILIYFLIKKLSKKQIIWCGSILLILVIGMGIIYFYNNDFFIKILGPSIFYRLDRLSSFVSDDSIQTTNALISIATSHTLYFPEMFNDFYIAYLLSKNIYLIIPIILCSLWLFMILMKKNTLLSKVVFYTFLFQCWWNLAMNLKLVPVIGIPYLFVSYGGSHIISSMILIGLVISFSNSKDMDMVLGKDNKDMVG